MWIYIIAGIACLLAYWYYKATKNFGKFAALGIAEVKGEFPLGSETNRKMITQKESFVTFLDDLYFKHKKDKVVVYHTHSPSQPAIMLTDIDLAKQVLIKDFDHFMDRRSFGLHDGSKANKIFNRMLSIIGGEKWKLLRATLSPIFTTGKLKAMSTFMNRCGTDLSDYMEKLADTKEPFIAKQLLTNYTTDVICSAGLGVETDCVKNPDNYFRKMVAKISGQDISAWVQAYRMIMVFFFPALGRLLKVSFIDEKATEFFIDVIEKSIEERKGNKGPKRNDFIDLFLSAMKEQDKELESLKEDDQFEKDAQVKVGSTKFSDIPKEELHLLMLAQVLVLFFGGFDTSSSMMAVAMVFLAKNPEAQEKLRAEILAKIDNSADGTASLNYTEVNEMEYLDMFVYECLRIYPLTVIERQCTKAYKLPGTDLTIEPGWLVQIPGPSMMKDPEYFEDPETFDPELHFNAEAKAKRNPYVFLSFGQGPRNCIGIRFALLQFKVSLIHILSKFRVIPNEKTPKGKLDPNPISPTFQPKGETWVSVEKL